MDELRVPKRRTLIEIVFPSGASRQLAMFLAEFATQHAGPERPSDLLNGTIDFLPAVEVDTGEMTLLHRTGIAVARVPAEVESDESDQLTIPTEHEVEITLTTGVTLNGLISYVLPPERSRLADYLNVATPFFRLLQQQSVSLVNKRHVSQVRVVEKRP
jgi:hypothetical protein